MYLRLKITTNMCQVNMTGQFHFSSVKIDFERSLVIIRIIYTNRHEKTTCFETDSLVKRYHVRLVILHVVLSG